MKKDIAVSHFLIASLATSQAQLAPEASRADSTRAATPIFTFTGYVDAYYAYDLNRPVVSNYTNAGEADAHLRPTFLYNHNRHNEFNINNAFVKAAYAAEQVRGNVALQVGTYAQYNYAGEEGLLRNVFEANAGVRLAKEL